jgi:chemotaxis receptor (MCP) glutamine deamidase CheD
MEDKMKTTRNQPVIQRMFGILFILVLVSALFSSQGTYSASAQGEEPTSTPNNYTIQDGQNEIVLAIENYYMPDELVGELTKFLANNRNNFGNALIYGIVYYEEHSNWSWINIEVGDGEFYDNYETDAELGFLVWGLFAAKINDNWVVTLNSDKEILFELFDKISEYELMNDELDLLSSYYSQYSGEPEIGALSGNLLFPWDKTQNPWKVGSLGIHDAGFASYVGAGSKALDFVPQLSLSTPAYALSMEGGYIDLKIDCQWNTVLIVRHDGYSQKFLYHHIQKGTAPSQGQITRGKNLGTLRIPVFNRDNCSSYGLSGSCEVDTTPNGGLCSVSNGRHLHLGYGTDSDISIDGKKPSTMAKGDSLYSSNSSSTIIQTRNAQYVSQSVPTTMTAGQQYSVSVTMKNTGSTSWTYGTNFKLGSQNPQDNTTWGSNRTYLSSGETIATNQNKTFTFTVRAPSVPGTYNFRWRMLQEGVAWFGDLTPNVAVNVQAGGNAPSTPSSPSPSSGTTLSRTNNTTLYWSTNGTSCQVFIQGGSINISPSGGCSSLALGQQRGGAYSWYVKSTNSYGTTTGPTWYFNIRPYGPSNLGASAVSASQINLNWTLSSDDDSTNVDGYDIYRNGSYLTSVNKGVSSYQSTGLACNTSYSFYVRSKRQGVQSDNSNTVSATTGSCAPGTPTLNSPANNATVGRYDTVTLSWNSASGATQYYAEFWGDSGISINSGWTSNLSFNVGSTFWGGTYQWRVKSRNSSNVESGWSETRTLYRLYGTPTSLTASGVSQSQINLSWGASADAPGNIQGYRIYRNGTAIETVGSSTTSYSDTGVSCNNSYSYTVRAYKGTLESNTSNSASASTVNCPPNAPSNLTVSGVTSSSVTLSWQDNSNNESGFKIYRWGYGQNGWAFYYLTTVGVNATTYTQTELECNNDFNYYEISSYNSHGESARVGWVQGTTSPCPVPVNDDFNSPKVISQNVYTDTLDTRGATVASDDPEMSGCGLGTGNATVWYRFTPSISGQIQVDTIGSTYDTVLSVWTGSRGNLASQGCNDDRRDEYGSFIDLQSGLTVNVQAGVPYYIEVAQYNGSASATGMSAQSIEKPAAGPEVQVPGADLGVQGLGGDDVSAMSIGGTLKLNFKFAQADLIVTSMSVSPANPPAHQPASITVQIKNQGQADAADFWVDVYLNRQPAACQNIGNYFRWVENIPPGETRSVTILLSTFTTDGLPQGNHQLIAYVDVDCLVGESNENNNQYGPINLSVGAPLPPPANDAFSAAKTISTTPYIDIMDTRGATVTLDDPVFDACALNAGKGTVWYKFTAPNSGMAKIETAGSDYDTVLGLFTGSQGNLTLIDCNDDLGWVNDQWDTSSSLFLNLNAGVTYYINVTKYGGPLPTGASSMEAQSIGGDAGQRDQSSKKITEDDLSALSGGTLKLSVTGPGAGIKVIIGGDLRGNYALKSGEERREYYNASGGPVKVESLDLSKKIVSAIRLQSFANNTLYSFVETMGVPQGLLSHKYYFPTYNNTWGPLNSQVRFSNLDATATRIRVTIGGVNVWEQDVPGLGERRLNFNVSGGPVVVESLDTNKKIVAAIRLQSYANNTLHSFSETMGIPNEYVSHKYYFPTYNNTWAPLNSQIRFGNLASTQTRIRVTIGGVNVWEQDVPGLEERRLNFNVSGGPVVVESLDSSKKIVAAIRLQSYAGNTLHSFVETMGVPDGLLSHKYYFPTYNNTWEPLNSQVRFGNLNATTTRIRVTIGGVNVWEQDVPGLEERRLNFSVSGGPVIVESLDSGKKIVAAVRLQSFGNNTLYSFSETMGIPAAFLADVYYFPTYNNTWGPLNSQLRFGVP